MKRQKIGKMLVLLAGVGVLSLLLTHRAFVQDEPFSDTELRQLKALSKKDAGAAKACMGFEATFSAPLKEQPKAMLDVERLHLIEGAISKVLEVITVSPQKYKMMVNDPAVCQKIQESRQDISVSIQDGKGADGKKLFPTERRFSTK